MRGILIFFLLISPPVFLTAADQKSDSKKILCESFTSFPSQQFIGTVENPYLTRPGIQRIKVFHKMERSGEKEQRSELYDKNGELIASFIVNNSGEYMVSGDGKIRVIGGAFNSQHYMEFPFQPLYEPEFSLSEYEMQEISFMGEKCWKITMSLPDDKHARNEIFMQNGLEDRIDESLAAIYEKQGLSYPSPQDNFFLYHPALREYIIGQQSKMIYSRCDYDPDGKLLWRFEYSSIELNPNWSHYPDIFSSPAKIMGRLSNEADCMNVLDKRKQNRFYIQPKPKFRWLRNIITFVSDSPAQQTFLLVSIGVILVGMGVWIHAKRSK